MPKLSRSRDSGLGHDPYQTPGMPRWVKVAGIIVALAVLLFVALQLTGGAGGHGPSRHSSPGDTSSADVTQPPGGHQPPPGGHS